MPAKTKNRKFPGRVKSRGSPALPHQTVQEISGDIITIFVFSQKTVVGSRKSLRIGDTGETFLDPCGF